MHSDDDTPVTKQEDSNDTLPENVTVSLDEIETPKKSDAEDPKPRIVLTFRSEKSGTKSSNMKIVSSEEKHEEISPRRSIRTRNSKKDSDEEIDSDDEEIIEIPSTTKRSTRRRSKEYCDVIANAIARKIKSYNEPSSTPTQRLSRRIKPTTKVLANQELRMGPESQNNARLGIATDKPVEEGVRTRRSAQAKSTEPQPEKKLSKRKVQEESANESSDKESDYSSKKLIHLCNLGLKVKDEESSEADNSAPLRRSSRKANSGLYYYDPFTVDDPEDSDYEPKRKSSRSHGGDEGAQTDPETKTQDGSEAAPADEEGSEAAYPSDNSIIATCLCEETSNIYAAPSELTEPVFCQAIEVVEGVRVGCSHVAEREAAGTLRPLRRAGPRAPYFLACRLHAAQLAAHLCCPTCGLFCTQGIFNQCSKGHLFHLECAIQGVIKLKTGCPHCGVYSYRWQPVNHEYSRVQVDMHCSNQRVFLPDQREQSTMAVLGFSSLEPSQLDVGPLIPEDLLPSMPLDLKKLFETESEDDSDYSIDALYEAIMAGESVEQLIPKIVRGARLNTPLRTCAGGTLAHAAARRAALPALCLLRLAGADLDARDRAARTPLVLALLALVDKETTDEGDNEVIEAETTIKKEGTTEESEEVAMDVKKAEDEEVKTEIKEEEHQEDVHKPSKEDLLKVIKFLIAADCDLNKEGPEGMTALHVAAQHGAGAAARALLAAGARRDARDAGGWTPLVRAAENGHDDIVRLLVSQGAEAAARDAEGNLPLHWCALAGRARALALLLRAAPAARDAPNAHADTPLHIAAREDHYDCVMVLLAHGARTDLENSAGELAVEVCTDRCHAAILLNMQMTLAVKGKMSRARILSSDISNGREPFPVACVNEVDDAPLPDDFTYVSQMVAPEHVPVDDSIQTMQGCSCTDECGEECACCTLGVRRWYRGGRLPAAFPYHDPPMLFECNQTCKCNMKRCSNRVVGAAEARGSLARAAQVYRTAAAGWGLRAAAAAPRGALLALYRGELLPRARADARPDDQYMFALDIKPDLLEQCSDQSELCVDASRYGSAARFMNHSCRPTAAAVRVFTSARDLRRPHVAFFALRDLPAFTPLTFDYGDKFWSVKSKFMKCECESPDCRYPTKTTDTNDS